MHKLKEMPRQKLALGRSHREISASLRVSIGKVGGVCLLAKRLELDWPAVEQMSDDDLEATLYPRPEPQQPRAEPDWPQVHLEMRRKGVTLLLLNIEYLEQHPGGYRYSAFCERYHEWLKKRSPVMRQVHAAGDKMFVDYAGTTIEIVDPRTGEVSDAQVFVAVLGASNYTYAEVSRSQKVASFCGSVSRALSFFGGVPAAVVPDNLKSAVTHACRKDTSNGTPGAPVPRAMTRSAPDPASFSPGSDPPLQHRMELFARVVVIVGALTLGLSATGAIASCHASHLLSAGYLGAQRAQPPEVPEPPWLTPALSPHPRSHRWDQASQAPVRRTSARPRTSQRDRSPRLCAHVSGAGGSTRSQSVGGPRSSGSGSSPRDQDGTGSPVMS